MTRFAHFVVAGGIAALLNFGSRILLSLTMPYAASIVVAYCIGMLTAFVLNRAFVFKESSSSLQRQATRFTLINLLAVVQTLLISILLARQVFPVIGMEFHAETVAHAIGVAVPVFTSYLGHKHFSFK